MEHDKFLFSFSTLFPFLFLNSFAGVMELWCFWLFVLSRPCFQEWSPLSLSVLDDLEIPQHRGLECHCDIPRWPKVRINANRNSFLWPRTAENASAVPSVIFISTRSTDIRRVYPSSLRGSGHLRPPVSFDSGEEASILHSRECRRCLGWLGCRCMEHVRGLAGY